MGRPGPTWADLGRGVEEFAVHVGPNSTKGKKGIRKCVTGCSPFFLTGAQNGLRAAWVELGRMCEDFKKVPNQFNITFTLIFCVDSPFLKFKWKLAPHSNWTYDTFSFLSVGHYHNHHQLLPDLLQSSSILLFLQVFEFSYII